MPGAEVRSGSLSASIQGRAILRRNGAGMDHPKTGSSKKARSTGADAEEPRGWWKRRRPSADNIDLEAASQHPVSSPPDRFAVSSLQPVGSRTVLFAGAKDGEKQPRWLRRTMRPVRMLDWGLLCVEVLGALVVGWLSFQYIYTAYFDTAPRRLSGSAASIVPTHVVGVLPLVATASRPTPTRVSEVDEPMVGGGTGRPFPLQPTATRTLIPTPTTPPTPTVAAQLLLPTRLRIPAMFLDSVVREVTVNMGTWEVAPMDIGHHEGTGVPGEQGNVVLAGHRDINSALFRDLDRLKPGNDLFVTNSLGEYRYVVKESFVVGPSHTEVMDPTGDRRVTLITCTPIGLDTQRLIVVAELDDSGQPGTGQSR
ncbi:MAG: sortase [Chloroflexota bacterium]|nr:sortase [Chloroflexota bacterium]